MRGTYGTTLLIVGVLVGLLVPTALGNRRANSDEAPNAAVTTAIDALRAEVNAYVADPANATIRTKSDYFTPATAPDEASIVAALGQRLDRNAVIDSYIKWQLLSGVAEFSADNRRALLQVYRRAPSPVRLAGIDKAEQTQLDQVVQNGSESDIITINEQWGLRNEEARRSNQIIVGYRDALFGRLPVDADVLELGLRDAVERANAGLDPRKFSELVAQRTRMWAINGAPPQQLHAMSRLFMALREGPAVQVYTSVEWKSNKVQWRKDTRRVNPKVDTKNPQNDAFYVLATELVQMAQNPSGGLKLKSN